MTSLLIAAPHKSSGKTTITLGLCAALTTKGYKVQPFKKGPDYIDPMWLGHASGMPAYNLDFNTMSQQELITCFNTHASGSDIAIIEGNMGLFDSLDVEGKASNAELAKLLEIPVVLVVDVRGATRSVAALIKGFVEFDPEIKFAGVILNNVAGERHATRLRDVLTHYLPDLPLLGMVHRDRTLNIDERHLGLVPSNELGERTTTLSCIAEKISHSVDLELLLNVAGSSSRRSTPQTGVSETTRSPIRLGIARSKAFGFYYNDDLAALEYNGAKLIPIDLEKDRAIPEVDGLFIGGGFPETRMQCLEANHSMRTSVANAIEAGMPCYAECGGLMYLCRSISWGQERSEMVGVIPADVVMHRKPVGRGYIRLRESINFPWPGGPLAESGEFNAHEFHHSSLENLPTDTQFAYEVLRGVGINGKQDGIMHRNLLASYTHLRDTDANHWAERFIHFIRERLVEYNGTKHPQSD